MRGEHQELDQATAAVKVNVAASAEVAAFWPHLVTPKSNVSAFHDENCDYRAALNESEKRVEELEAKVEMYEDCHGWRGGEGEGRCHGS